MPLLRTFWALPVSTFAVLASKRLQYVDHVLVNGSFVFEQPTRDDGPRPSNTAPAVDVHRLSRADEPIDGVKNVNEARFGGADRS